MKSLLSFSIALVIVNASAFATIVGANLERSIKAGVEIKSRAWGVFNQTIQDPDSEASATQNTNFLSTPTLLTFTGSGIARNPDAAYTDVFFTFTSDTPVTFTLSVTLSEVGSFTGGATEAYVGLWHNTAQGGKVADAVYGSELGFPGNGPASGTTSGILEAGHYLFFAKIGRTNPFNPGVSSFSNVNLSVSPVPEPSGVSLLVFGAVVVGAFRRNRSQKAQG